MLGRTSFSVYDFLSKRPSRWGLEYADACANSVRYQGLDATLDPIICLSRCTECLFLLDWDPGENKNVFKKTAKKEKEKVRGMYT